MHHPQRLTVHEWASIRTELYWAYDDKIPADAVRKTVPKEWGCRALFLREGTLDWTTRSRHFSVSKGMWLMAPPEGWTQRFSPDAHVISLFFTCQWPSGLNVLAHDGLVFPGAESPELESCGGALALMVAQSAPIRDKRQLFQGRLDEAYAAFYKSIWNYG